MKTTTLTSTPRRLILALVAAGAVGATGAGLITGHQARALTPPPAIVAQTPAAPGGALPSFAQITAQNGPAVVNISVTGSTKAAMADDDGEDEGQPAARQGRAPQMDPNDPFYQFFRQFGFPGGMGPQAQPNVPTHGQGSGFIVSPDGLVLTNAHVVKGASEVIVKLTDRREFRAKVLGSDPKTDVAVLKIDAKNLPTVRLGSTRDLQVGEWVLAIGSPFGFENSVTAGVVSAKGRSLPDDSLVPFIQTDVAVNPGNSGGPLFNARGEVVGINSQIYSRSGGYMGISFAIPIDEATRVAEQLRSSGRVVRGRIGVQIGEVTKDVAESLGLPKAAGALVRSVEPGGPAEKAGLEAGDIVTRFDGKPVEKWSDLPRLVGNTKPGTKSTLQVLRRGSTRDLGITVAELEPEARPVAQRGKADPKAPPASTQVASLGLTVVDLTAEQRKELKLKGGVLISAVDGPAARAGVQEGDLVLAVANSEVTDARQFEALVARLDKSRPVNLLLRRGEWAQYVVIRPGR